VCLAKGSEPTREIHEMKEKEKDVKRSSGLDR